MGLTGPNVRSNPLVMFGYKDVSDDQVKSNSTVHYLKGS